MTRGQIGYLSYKVEKDGKFLSWNDVWLASEADGYIEKILIQPEFDIIGNMVTNPVTKREYGRVFIVRVYDSPE